MARGRPSDNLLEDEKLALRREKVRLNVQAHRQRQKEKKRLEALDQQPQPSLRWISENERQGLHSTCSRDQPKQSRPQQSSSASTPRQSCSLLYGPNPEKQYTLSLLGMLRTRYLPERVTLPHAATDERLYTPCALWIVKGCDLAAAEENSVVKRMYRAFGLAILGTEHQRDDIQAASLHTYHQTLASISRQLSAITKGGSLRIHEYLALFISCHAAAIFQLSVNGSMARMFEYVRGIGSVLVHHLLQPDSVSRDWQALADEYRLLEIVFCLIYRKPSILAGTSLFRRGSTNAPAVQSHDLKHSKSSQLDELVFIARHIPPIMCYLDDVKACKPSRDQVPEEMHSARDCLSYVMTELERWSVSFLDRHARAVVQSDPYILGHGDLDFPGLEVASTWTFWLSFKVHALESYISILQIPESSQHDNSERYACENNSSDARTDSYNKGIKDAREDLLETIQLLIRSMPYLLEADIGYIGRSFVAFPLETIRVALLHELERSPRVSPGAVEPSVPPPADGRMPSIMAALTSCSQIAKRAKAMSCALFSDDWPNTSATAFDTCHIIDSELDTHFANSLELYHASERSLVVPEDDPGRGGRLRSGRVELNLANNVKVVLDDVFYDPQRRDRIRPFRPRVIISLKRLLATFDTTFEVEAIGHWHVKRNGQLLVFGLITENFSYPTERIALGPPLPSSVAIASPQVLQGAVTVEPAENAGRPPSTSSTAVNDTVPASVGGYRLTASQAKPAGKPRDAARRHWRTVRYANLPRVQGEGPRGAKAATTNHRKALAQKPATTRKVSFLDQILGAPVKSASRGSGQSKDIQTPTKVEVAGKQKFEGKNRAPPQAAPSKSSSARVGATHSPFKQITGRKGSKTVTAAANLYESIGGSSTWAPTKAETNKGKEQQENVGKGSSVPENTPVNLTQRTSQKPVGAVGEELTKMQGNNAASPKDAARDRWSKVWLYDLPRADKDTK
ncbi:hypothetical protein H2200_007102 [Cladophialophora chaetospira]|uniref:Uncharacterized protein n=1 Tax=Cladophialophora chaetospira TaxID=386627 RepID=A0AA39CH55_9EURO|nr:hypothetical protein H2200_007102 [Cladophialophora chaetospira]